MCLLTPMKKGTSTDIQMLLGVRRASITTLVFGGVKIGKTKLRIMFIVACVELPVGWKSAWPENAQRSQQSSVSLRHLRYREKRCWDLIPGNPD